ncbi:hypothetical protein [Sphaerothrix gracilis]|uniref:hypothetical protein n=1 Tax=Sphaerothrix gracilis TaxID=3151835 RepID=UPI0031FCCB65
MTLDRLATVQDGLDRLYEQLAGEERALDLAEEAEKTRIQQKVRLTRQRIHEREQEYTIALSQQVRRQAMPEAVAETVTAELVDELEVLTLQERRDEVKDLLQQILAELQKPELPASAKLKVAIPLIPNVVSYELEGDTEGVIKRLFPTFLKAYEGLRSLAPGNPKK